MNSLSESVSLIVAAAGKSTRFAAGSGHSNADFSSKLLLTFQDGESVIGRSIRQVASALDFKEIVLVASPELFSEFQKRLAALDLEIKFVAGGESRFDSVQRGFRALGEQSEFVMIHDGARPNCKFQEVREVFRVAKETGAALLARPVTSTIKQAVSEQSADFPKVEKTIARQHLWAAQTPQVFRSSLLEQAYDLAGEDKLAFTDESALVEATGAKVSIVPGSSCNIKITRPGDLALANFYAQSIVS